jgi:hypothetical protein
MAGIHISDYSSYYSQLAIQGPRALETLQKLTKVDLAAIKNYWFTFGQVAGVYNTLIARTGYSGEDGFEIYIPSDVATPRRSGMPCSKRRGVRHPALRPGRAQHPAPRSRHAPLRTRNHRPDQRLEAGLDRWLKLEKDSDFLAAFHAPGDQGKRRPNEKLVGLEMVDRGIARDGYPVLNEAGEQIGIVTSGSPAPFLKTNIAYAYVPTAVAESKEDVFVQVRANKVRAKQVPTPFYKRVKNHHMRAHRIIRRSQHIRVLWIIAPVVFIHAIGHHQHFAAHARILRRPALGQIRQAEIWAAVAACRTRRYMQPLKNRRVVRRKWTGQRSDPVLHISDRGPDIRRKRLHKLAQIL